MGVYLDSGDKSIGVVRGLCIFVKWKTPIAW